MNEREEKDMKSWSTERICTWVDDSMMRYKVIGMDYEEAMSLVVTSLMTTAATLIALHTTATPREAGVQFAQLVHNLRLRKRQEQEQDGED